MLCVVQHPAVRGVQAEGDQERAPGHARLPGLLSAVRGHWQGMRCLPNARFTVCLALNDCCTS